MPQYVGDAGFDAASFRDHLGRAEELGFHSAWTQEQILGPAPTLSPLGAMSYAAACTERLRLGCAVFVTPLHNPVHLAKAIATVDHLSHGRVEIGVGTGGRRRPFAAFGIGADGLVTRFTEGVALMKACWTEHEINFDGRFWQVQGASMQPKPVQRPYPPIWFGGNHPNALRRAARIADGFIGAGSQSTEQFAEQVQVLRAALVELEREEASFALAKRVYIHIDDDREHADRILAEALTDHYGRGGPWDVGVVGSSRDCIDGLREVASAGAELILLNPLVDDREQMERLAAEVVPAFG
jgi:probable F420-dependent oxidoreductase